MLPGQSDADYEQMIDQDMIPAFDGFKPEVMLISAGFDAHVDDDMSGIQLTTQGFSWIMERIMELAQQHCGGRLVSILEGGYSLERLPELAGNHVRLLLAK
jgi:acetoin utilization deacetylase AcuC-like enzyme